MPLLCLPWLLLSVSTNAFLGKTLLHLKLSDTQKQKHHTLLPTQTLRKSTSTTITNSYSVAPLHAPALLYLAVYLAGHISSLWDLTPPQSHCPSSPICVSCVPHAGVAFLVALLLVTQKDPQAGFRLYHVANSSSSSSSSSSIKEVGLQLRPQITLPCNSLYIVSSTRLRHRLLPIPFQTTLTQIDCCP